MSLSPEDSERLKKVAIEAIGLVVGGMVVKYVWRHDRIQGYVYHLKDTSGSVLVGLVKEGKHKITQFSGRTVDSESGAPILVEIDTAEITETDVRDFEGVFCAAPLDQDPLQTG